MNTQAPSEHDHLFSESLIRLYVNAPHFVERPWLVEQIESALADPDMRFLLLTAEPGAGKTAIMAWLAHQQPHWLRYFIRRDSQTPLSHGDAKSFLFAIGHQLAALHPTLFRPDKLEVVVKQYLGTIQAGGRAIGIKAEDLLISPFYRTTLMVEQHGDLVLGELEGLSVKRMVMEKRFLELDNLQHLALIDPAKVLLTEDPSARIVIIADALDELRSFRGQESILDWLTFSPELPHNVRFILTARPDDKLTFLKQRQGTWLREVTIESQAVQVQSDLRQYAMGFTAEAAIRKALVEREINADEFVDQIVGKAEGNFQYLVALASGIEQTREVGNQKALNRLLSGEDVPTGLGDLYAFFLRLIKEWVSNKTVEVPGSAPFEVRHVPVWQEICQPILGVLAVAREPLDLQHIKRFGDIQAEERWIGEAFQYVVQFLDQVAGRYRFYHSTFPEFITASTTQTAYPDCYLTPAEWHRKIAKHYRGKAATWDEVAWSRTDDYGLLYLSAHLYALREREVFRRELYGLICKPFLREKYTRFGSHRPFTEDVLLTLQVSGSEEPPNLLQEVRGNLIYATMESLATNISVEVLAALVQVGQIARAMDFAVLMHDERNQLSAYGMIIGTLQANKEMEAVRVIVIVKQMLAVAETMEDQFTKAVMLKNAAEALVQAGEPARVITVVNRALAVAERIEDQSSKALILSGLAPALAQAGELPRAITIVNQALEVVANEGKDDASVLGNMVEILTQAGQVDQALKVAQTIENQFHKAFALGAVVKVLTRAGQVDQALKVAQTITDPDGKAHVQYEVARVLVQIREPARAVAVVNRALAVVETIKNQYSKALKLSEAAQILVQAGEPARAVAVANQALAVASMIKSHHMLSKIAQILVQAGEPARAATVVNQMLAVAESSENQGDKAGMLSEVAQVLAQTGEVGRAVTIMNQALVVAETIEDLFSQYYKVSALSGMAQVLAQTREPARAITVVNQALAVAETMNDPKWKVIALSEVTQVLAQIGEPARAVAVANQALAVVERIDNWQASSALVTMAEVLPVMAWAGEPAHVVTIVNRVLALSATIGEESVMAQDDQVRTQRSVAQSLQVLAQVGQVARARKVAQTMKDPYRRAEALSMLAQGLAQAGKAADALKIVKGIKGSYDTTEALSMVAQSLAQAGQVDKALKVAVMNKDPYDKVRVLIEIAPVLAQTGELPRAVTIVKEVLVVVTAIGEQSIEAQYYKALMLSKAAMVLAQAGEQARAVTIVNQVLAIIEMIEDKQSRAYVLSELVEQVLSVLVQTGQVAQALQVAQMIEDPYAKAKALIKMAPALAQAGQIDQILKLVETIKSEDWKMGGEGGKVGVLSRIGQALTEVGQQKQALHVLRTAFARARHTGREGIFDVLKYAAVTLGAIDEGQTLWRVYETLQEVDNWWGTQ